MVAQLVTWHGSWSNNMICAAWMCRVIMFSWVEHAGLLFLSFFLIWMFFRRGQKFASYINQERRRVCVKKLHPLIQQMDYSSHDCPSFLAPEATQSEASFLMLSSRIDNGAPLFRKTIVFLSFKMDNEMSVLREAIAFLFECFKTA